MRFFELEPADISALNDGDLRELVARLCEAELIQQGIQPSCVMWGGAQEAPDGGLDVHVKNAGAFTNPSFISRANTGIQVKKNSMGRAACKNEMLDKGNIKTIIAELANRNGAYIIVSGKDDCTDKMHSDRCSGMGEAIESLVNKDNLLLDFYGRDRLAVWLRQHPGVALWTRSRLGKPLSGWAPFGRWAATPIDQDDEFLLDDHPCVIDENTRLKEPLSLANGIQLTRDKLNHFGSTVRITGLSGVGKTRFAQALFETEVSGGALPATDVVYADLGNELTPTASELISYLIANDFSTYVVLDNCPPDVHRQLQKQVSQNSAKLRLLTIEYDISDDRPEETKVIHLEPSSEKTVSKLVQKRFPDLGYINAEKISEFAGGNARVAIALASRVDADETLTNFTDEELFQRLFSQRKGITDNLFDSAEALSLVYSFNVSPSDYNNELEALSAISGMDRRTLHKGHAELLRRKLSQKRGNWRAVLPHALANRLARRALENIPAADINDKLFKQENLRLFKSCAHRLGYLHDFEPAQHLASTWVLPGAPLHDLTSCDDELLLTLDFIAPVFPDTVLTAIETASTDPNFASRDNAHFTIFVRLLIKLAYEDDSFDRAVAVILKFAETEKEGENYNSVVNQLSNLFSLYLSGTQATPTHRQELLHQLLISNKPRLKEIAKELFNSAFESSHWSSSATFGFGARKRDTGWRPKTRQEVLGWYEGFISLLDPYLDSTDYELSKYAKALIATHFRGLWSNAGCFDILESIVTRHAKDGSWPEIWMSIKSTIFYDRKKQLPELQHRLDTLEKLASPSDPYSEIEAYALTNTWEHAEVQGGDYNEESGAICNKIVKLGELAACEPTYLEMLAPRLWEKHIDALSFFGEGLAKGCPNPSELFKLLVTLIQKQKHNQEQLDPILFFGFIKASHEKEPKLARKLLEEVLETSELKPYFIYLLSAAPIAPWGVKKLLEIARTSDIEAWKFVHLSYGRVHEAISDNDLCTLLEAINDLEGGLLSTLKILGMRFHIDKESSYEPTDTLRSVGRKTIHKLLSTHRDDLKGQSLHQLHELDLVAAQCLSSSSPVDEIDSIIKELCKALVTSRLSSFDLTNIINTLTKNFPELVLNNVFTGDDKEALLSHMLFREDISNSESPLNLVSVDRLIQWCDGDEDRINTIADAIYSFSSTDGQASSTDNPQQLILSTHTKALIDAAEDKQRIATTLFKDIIPTSYSGTLSKILEIRSKAFSELLEHSSPEIRVFTEKKLVLIQKDIHRSREREAREFSQREQRFE